MIWFPEAYRWADGQTWIGLMNPTTLPQDVRVTLLGRDIVRTLTVPARGRVSQELGTWGASADFGVEVTCGSVCAASLALWDRAMKTSVLSPPIVGCAVF